MFGFDQDQEFSTQEQLATCTHLQDVANTLGIETPYAFGIDASTDAEQLASIEQLLRDALAEAQAAAEAEERRNRRWPCNIGPYANGICTICGGSQP